MMDTHDEPRTVPSLDLHRYLGTWYEIARLPERHEPADYTDITATYTLDDDGSVRVDNRALDREGEPAQAIGKATVVEGSGNAKLEVSFMPEGLRWVPFTKGDYWVLRIDGGYHTALVGTPDRRHLWLLSRTPTIDPATRSAFLDTAVQQGYDLDGLITTPHRGIVTA
ncbi:apolipoprotein D and lipocalin family protein [Dokdonella fugitiva]|jgi:apolipoprotein D and lipocalin family protein|uniref:Outer membrane lipoprotein Blc n=2 Tax=Dokdonella fugitiva TaxID=328517 RepID=A0A4R2I9J2_9GAMM|nr:apolipoprotein D and lipocalin family protein [Dokdonella fugitiva]